jgi:hypothetical protein
LKPGCGKIHAAGKATQQEEIALLSEYLMSLHLRFPEHIQRAALFFLRGNDSLKTVVMQYIGQINGRPAYSPLAESVAAVAGQAMLVFELKGDRAQRTLLQNAAMHRYFEMLANDLNGCGLDMITVMTVLAEDFDILWSPPAVKDRLWRPVQIETYAIQSTADIDKSAVSLIYESLSRVLIQKFGLHVPFPDSTITYYDQLSKR